MIASQILSDLPYHRSWARESDVESCALASRPRSGGRFGDSHNPYGFEGWRHCGPREDGDGAQWSLQRVS